jgi:hypothetical protein
VYQVAYVTRDLDEALAAMARLGATAFQRIEDVVLASEAGTTATISMALGRSGPTMLELIEPRGGDDGVFREGLPSPPVPLGFHHLCYRVETLDALAGLRAAYEAGGVAIRFPNAAQVERARFFYADLRPTLGHLVEYLYLPAARLAFHASLPRNPPVRGLVGSA